MSTQLVTRVTLFKIPSAEDQQRLIDLYRTLATKALKDGKPYIVSASAGPTFEDARNQGYTLAASTTFATLEDWEYYDEQCSAHGEIKKLARTIHRGAMMVYFQNVL